MSGENDRTATRARRSSAALAWIFLWACTNGTTPSPGDAPPATRPSVTETAEPAAESEDEDVETLDEEAPARPVDELDEPELEAECFRGRQEACDLLGH